MKEMQNSSDLMSSFIEDRQEWNQKYKTLVEEAFKDPDVQRFLSEEGSQLTKEEIEKSYSKIFEFVRQKKKSKEREEDKRAGLVPRLIVNTGYIDVAYEPSELYQRNRKKQAIQSKIQARNISKQVRFASIATLKNTLGRSDAFQALKEFLLHFKESRTFQKGFYLYGTFGVGKSYFLGAVANQLAERGVETLMVHLPSLIEELKSSFTKESGGSINEKIEEMKQVEILMIDDIGAENITAWSRDAVLNVILEYRMQEEKITFFTSNLDFPGLENHLTFTKDGEEPMKAKRIMERIKFLSKEVKMYGENLRNEEGSNE
ncbi:MAG: primosomal protein DnaI [Streptococcaceae bacterium]|jgi:primosomal protein DnaI|nr:primosomal protein DnaI [Streptococcaceae bacterium]